MQVMMLAAGRSTRLAQLGTQLPKPIAPVCGYPPITFGLALVRSAGLSDVVVNVHHRPQDVISVLGDGAQFGVNIRYSRETELLNTGGALTHARPLFRSEPVLILNGKIVAGVDLAEVLAAHEKARARGAVATMVVRKPHGPDTPTPVQVGDDRVVGLRGTLGSYRPNSSIEARMFVGIHVVESALLDRLPPGPTDVIAEAYLPALAQGDRVHAHEMQGYYQEHSTPAQYLAGNLDVLGEPSQIKAPPGPLTGVADGAQVDPGAKLVPPYRIANGAVVEAGAIVGPQVVLGSGAQVASGVQVQRAVVWPDVHLGADLQDAIATPEGVVQPK